MKIPHFLALIIGMAGTATNASAQAEIKTKADTINSDRPDQTESPHIVPMGKLQIEAGFAHNPFDSAGENTLLIGMAVLRYGISKKAEIRLMAEEGRDRDRYLEETAQGVFPLAIGGKLLLLERESGIIPQTALLAWLKLPITSRSSEQSIYWSPQIALAFENKIGDKLELEYNGGAKQKVYGSKWLGLASISLHLEITDKLKLFGEYFGQYQPDEDPSHNYDAGATFLLSQYVQLDACGGRSFSAPYEQSSSFVSIGFSVLFH